MCVRVCVCAPLLSPQAEIESMPLHVPLVVSPKFTFSFFAPLLFLCSPSPALPLFTREGRGRRRERISKVGGDDQRRAAQGEGVTRR